MPRAQNGRKRFNSSIVKTIHFSYLPIIYLWVHVTNYRRQEKNYLILTSWFSKYSRTGFPDDSADYYLIFCVISMKSSFSFSFVGGATKGHKNVDKNIFIF